MLTAARPLVLVAHVRADPSVPRTRGSQAAPTWSLLEATPRTSPRTQPPARPGSSFEGGVAAESASTSRCYATRTRPRPPSATGAAPSPAGCEAGVGDGSLGRSFNAVDGAIAAGAAGPTVPCPGSSA